MSISKSWVCCNPLSNSSVWISDADGLLELLWMISNMWQLKWVSVCFLFFPRVWRNLIVL